ncbi:IS3 family transposase [Micromonospora sicca]|uniref:IS3 family transposase n=1 Tax=Micromonospora sicca TaxID=2202420 RepID=A0A317DR87_9ACTN|nr:IS3 family transposase [Micromonospora sp. ATA51]PWR17157.1 IS3 family transposase [Micromonospora sp. 4G51]
MIYPVVADLAAGGIAVAVACRVLGVSTSGYYDWRSRPVSPREAADQALGELIRDIHQMSRGTYGSPRVHAELRLAAGVRCGRKRVERLMRVHGLQGVYRRRRTGCTVRDPQASSADLVNRRFVADRPDALWVTDITQHRTQGGWVYCAVVLDVFARRVVGWSIADHLRSELVIDALDMARWRRPPARGRPWSTPITAANTRLGRSGSGSGRPACSAPWAPSATATTTAWSSPSSAPCSWNCSTGSPGQSVRNWPTPSSSGSRPDTTHADATQALATYPRSTTDDNRPRPQPRDAG